MVKNKEFTEGYLEKLTGLIQECLVEGSRKHGVLILADAETDVISVFTVNTPEEVLPVLLDTARHVLAAEVVDPQRTIN